MSFKSITDKKTPLSIPSYPEVWILLGISYFSLLCSISWIAIPPVSHHIHRHYFASQTHHVCQEPDVSSRGLLLLEPETLVSFLWLYYAYWIEKLRTLYRDISASGKNSDDCNNRRRKPKGQGYDIAGRDCGGNKSCDEAAGFPQHGTHAFRYAHSKATSKSQGFQSRKFEE